MTIQFDQWRARSPFYDDSHEAVAASVRRFMAQEVLPHIDRWEAEGELPRSLHKKAAEAGILSGAVIYGAEQASEIFRRDMEMARAEVQAARARRSPPANATAR